MRLKLKDLFSKVIGERKARVIEEVEKSKKTEKTVSSPTKAYVKALSLQSLADVEVIKREIKAGNVIIARITPLAKKNIEDVKRAINDLCEYTESLEGDIARLGEERVVVTPPSIKIWKKRTEEPKLPESVSK